MNAEFFHLMLDYQYWSRDRLLAAAEGMTDEELTKPNGFTYGNILGILAHCLGAEYIWFQRIQGLTPDPATAPNQNTIKTFADLKSRWQEMEANWRAFMAKGIDPEQEYVLRGRDGVDRT